MARCCPARRGCNWRQAVGYGKAEACLLEAATRCNDLHVALEMAEAFIAYESSRWWQILTRRRTHRNYRQALVACYHIGLEYRSDIITPLPPWAQVSNGGMLAESWGKPLPVVLGRGEQAKLAILDQLAP